jgi:hypothetical protein
MLFQKRSRVVNTDSNLHREQSLIHKHKHLENSTQICRNKSLSLLTDVRYDCRLVYSVNRKTKSKDKPISSVQQHSHASVQNTMTPLLRRNLDYIVGYLTTLVRIKTIVRRMVGWIISWERVWEEGAVAGSPTLFVGKNWEEPWKT